MCPFWQNIYRICFHKDKFGCFASVFLSLSLWKENDSLFSSLWGNAYRNEILETIKTNEWNSDFGQIYLNLSDFSLFSFVKWQFSREKSPEFNLLKISWFLSMILHLGFDVHVTWASWCADASAVRSHMIRGISDTIKLDSNFSCGKRGSWNHLWHCMCSIKGKERNYSANESPYSQGYDPPSGHVWLWEVDHKEGGKWKWCRSVVSDSLQPHGM